MTYYNTQTQIFGHSHDDVARATNASFAPGTLQVGDYRLYEMAAEPAYNPDTQRIELTSTPVQRVGQPWLREWLVIDLSAKEVAAQLAAAKAEKHAEINAARLGANTSTFTHAGKVIACDQLSRSDIDGTNGFVTLYGTLPPGWPGGWKAVDNTYLPIADVAAWKAFYTSMFAAGAANFAKAQALKASLDTATTLAQVRGVVW